MQLSMPRLALGGVLRSLAGLRVELAVARLAARPSSRRVSGFSSLRALFMGTPPPILPATATGAAVAPRSAAELRALDVLGVVNFVHEELKIDAEECKALVKQKIDGAALLETSVDELRSYGMSSGAAHAIMRGIAPAVTEAQSATLTIFPPRPKNKGGNVTHETLTPAQFLRMFDVLKAPLRIATESGLVLGTAKTLVEAVEASRSGLRLLASRRYDDDYSSYEASRCSTALRPTARRRSKLSRRVRLPPTVISSPSTGHSNLLTLARS